MLLTVEAQERLAAADLALRDGRNVFALRFRKHYQLSMFFPSHEAAQAFWDAFAAEHACTYDSIVEVTPEQYREINDRMLK